MGELIED